MGRYDWEERHRSSGNSSGASGLRWSSGLVALLVVGILGAALRFSGTKVQRNGGPESPRSSQSAAVRVVEHQAVSSRPVAEEPASASGNRPPQGAQKVVFEKCGSTRFTCVVDGDTFWLNGEKIRIADIDTPEVSQPQCPEEMALGIKATERLIVLLNDGPFELVTGDRNRDAFGRLLRIVRRKGQSIGGQLVAEGVAREWGGRQRSWCV